MFSTITAVTCVIIGATVLFACLGIGLARALETTCIDIPINESDLD